MVKIVGWDRVNRNTLALNTAHNPHWLLYQRQKW
jgi:hypothetical protein